MIALFLEKVKCEQWLRQGKMDSLKEEMKKGKEENVHNVQLVAKNWHENAN